jgi:Uma2 family endonuclease
MSSAPRKHLITVDEYYRMAEVGLLAPDARVELIEGEIIDMVPIGIPHARAVSHLARLFTLAVGDRAIVRPQLPVRLSHRSEPEPDIAVLAPRADEYGRAHPVPADVLHICRSPREGRYTDCHGTREPGRTRLAALPDIEVDLSKLLQP